MLKLYLSLQFIEIHFDKFTYNEIGFDKLEIVFDNFYCNTTNTLNEKLLIKSTGYINSIITQVSVKLKLPLINDNGFDVLVSLRNRTS